MSVLFGVAGNSDTFTETVSKASADAPAWLHAIGLDAYEYQCGKGVRVGEATARQIGKNAAQAGIRLSLHAPYFISLANPDPETVKKSIGYVTASCRAAQWWEPIGSSSLGALMKRTRREPWTLQSQSESNLGRLCGTGVRGCDPLSGDHGEDQPAGGSDPEVLELCQVDERLVPCVDFGHLYARSLGALDGADACKAMLDEMADALGEERASRFHSHFSKIAFTPKGGEQKHLRFSDEGWGPEFRPLAEEIARRGWSPTFICESSGTQSEDALTMKTIYQEVSRS